MTDPFDSRETPRDGSSGRPRTLDVIASGAGERTFVPREADAGERATAWITVDREYVIDLEGWR